MLRSLLDTVKNYSIQASDGPIGSIEDFYLDDREWIVRYSVIDTGTWLLGRRVILSPSVFRIPDADIVTFHTHLTKDAVKHSPSWDEVKPVSRQHETALSEYY